MNKTCCFTGHRPKSLPFGYDEGAEGCKRLKALLTEGIEKQITENGVTHFISGMAMGVDIYAAEAVLELKDMLNGITELLNEVIADPESIQIPKSDHEESQEIKRLNAEISKALNTVSFDKEAIKQKMFTCVSEKFTSLGTEEITAQSLKDIFKTVPPLTAYDSDLTDQAVSEIQLKGNGTISLILINGQRIGKEKSA